MSQDNKLISIDKPTRSLQPSFPPAKLLESLSPSGFTDVFECRTRALSVVKKEDGPETAALYIMLLLGEIEEFYGVDKKLSTQQVKALAKIILKEYYYFKISDLKLFAENFKLGLYGKIYNRIDGGVIMEALAKYDAERAERAAEYSQKQASKHKAPVNGGGLEVLQKIVDNWKELKPTSKPVFTTVEVYCRYTGKEKEDVLETIRLEAEISHRQSGIDMEFDDYLKFYTSRWLLDRTIEERKKS